MPRIGDILHYKPKATGTCSLAFVREVNADKSLDLMVIDSGPATAFKALMSSRAVLTPESQFPERLLPALEGAGIANGKLALDDSAITFPGGCFVFAKTCGEAGERRCTEAEVGKWHRPEPRRGDWVIWGKEEYAHPAIVIQVGDVGPRLLKLWVLTTTGPFETSALYGTGHNQWRWPEET